MGKPLAPKDEGAGAPASNIEITPEMIAAGLSEISGFELIEAWEGSLPKKELVSAIYRAMAETNLQPLSGRPSLKKCRE